MNKSARLQMHRDLARRQVVKPDPWELIEFRGWTMSRYTAAALSVLEEELGYELTIVNGPYNDDVAASANTHNEDAVVDLAPYQARRKCMASRKHGWASWIRPYNWNGRGGGKHLHQVLKGARDVNELAEWQRDVAYPNRWSGLVGNATDNFPYHPELTAFDYNAWWHDGLLEKQIDGINARIKGLRERISALIAKRKLLKARLSD